MRISNSDHSWGAVHQAFHWLVAPLVVIQIVVGFAFMAPSSGDPCQHPLFTVHTTLGLIIFLLTLARLRWRLTHPVPALPETLSPGLQTIARATHRAFYVLLIALPVTGYVMLAATNEPIPFFGLSVPSIFGGSKATQHSIIFPFLVIGAILVHVLGALLLTALIVLHGLGALRHEFWLKDNTLRRMTPLKQRPDRGRSARRDRGPDSVRRSAGLVLQLSFKVVRAHARLVVSRGRLWPGLGAAGATATSPGSGRERARPAVGDGQ